jgi:hypothetical protein
MPIMTCSLWKAVFVPTLLVVVLAGMLLPGTQCSGHPRSVVQAVTSVLFFLEGPAREWGVEDSDLAMILIRLFSTVVCGSLVGAALTFGIGAILKRDITSASI